MLNFDLGAYVFALFKRTISSILKGDYLPQVRNLQRQLQEEIDMHLALTDAIAHNAELILKSSTKLPNKVHTSHTFLATSTQYKYYEYTVQVFVSCFMYLMIDTL
jgi:hypothetical protein